MNETVQHTEDLQRIGTKNISHQLLVKSIYKSLGMKTKLNKNITPAYIEHHIQSKQLIYHPIWMVKNMVLAGRPPFPPKKIPRVIFVDAVSGYRGLFSHVPHLRTEKQSAGEVITHQIDETSLEKYISDVQAKQINRAYLMKKPRHVREGTTLAYLPIWKVSVKSDLVNHVFFINANTGENEQFMSDRWKSGKNLIR